METSLERGLFKSVALGETNSRWGDCISRKKTLYSRSSEIRSEFARDYNRILHCTAYRRLKHKTQVFFSVTNDHVCTRMEHVNHVTSVSYTISEFLGLNSELAVAIAIGHDLGHAPFGHAGEKSIEKLYQKIYTDAVFWHERNSLRFVDHIETLESPSGKHANLNLTYAVRDGIVCHCGEVDELRLIPREEKIDLNDIEKPGQVQPYTWEGCVVKVSDKISYLGRDIEDALCLNILDDKQVDELNSMLNDYGIEGDLRINNTMLIHSFIIDLCKNSDRIKGIGLSEKYSKLMKDVKKYNYKNIYDHKRIIRYKNYVDLVIFTLFEVIKEMALAIIKDQKIYIRSNELHKDFSSFLQKYSSNYDANDCYSEIDKIYNFSKELDIDQACIDYISGMTDTYANRVYAEVISF